MIRLGNIQLDVPFYQAPLSGYSERPMRILARRYGAPLTFTGVLLDKIAMHPKAVRKLRFQPGDDEHPVGAHHVSPWHTQSMSGSHWVGSCTSQ